MNNLTHHICNYIQNIWHLHNLNQRKFSYLYVAPAGTCCCSGSGTWWRGWGGMVVVRRWRSSSSRRHCEPGEAVAAATIGRSTTATAAVQSHGLGAGIAAAAWGQEQPSSPVAITAPTDSCRRYFGEGTRGEVESACGDGEFRV